MHIAKHEKNFPFHFPLLYKTGVEFTNPSSKIFKIPSFSRRRKCGRVVETGPKTNGKPVWISSAHSVAPSVPTPARSSKEWERFRCSGGLAGSTRVRFLSIPMYGRQCTVNLMKCRSPGHILRCSSYSQKWTQFRSYSFSETNTNKPIILLLSISKSQC